MREEETESADVFLLIWVAHAVKEQLPLAIVRAPAAEVSPQCGINPS